MPNARKSNHYQNTHTKTGNLPLGKNMKIVVIDTFSYLNVLHVKFHSSFGDGTALWSDTAPKIGEIIDVEFDFEEAFSWNINVKPTAEKSSKIKMENSLIQITAELVQADEEGYVALKLGDSIILIELDGPIPQKSGFVELSATAIQLYPTHI